MEEAESRERQEPFGCSLGQSSSWDRSSNHHLVVTAVRDPGTVRTQPLCRLCEVWRHPLWHTDGVPTPSCPPSHSRSPTAQQADSPSPRKRPPGGDSVPRAAVRASECVTASRVHMAAGKRDPLSRGARRRGLGGPPPSSVAGSPAPVSCVAPAPRRTAGAGQQDAAGPCAPPWVVEI